MTEATVDALATAIDPTIIDVREPTNTGTSTSAAP